VEVDPRAVLAEVRSLGRLAEPARDDRRQRRQPAVLVLDALKDAAAASAPISCRNLSPPSTLLPPRSLVSAVASTTLFALSTAVMSALSSRAVVCSVNWTS